VYSVGEVGNVYNELLPIPHICTLTAARLNAPWFCLYIGKTLYCIIRFPAGPRTKITINGRVDDMAWPNTLFIWASNITRAIGKGEP